MYPAGSTYPAGPRPESSLVPSPPLQFIRDDLLRHLFRRNRRTIWIADAHRSDGKLFVVRADEKLTAFVELETAIHEFAVSLVV